MFGRTQKGWIESSEGSLYLKSKLLILHYLRLCCGRREVIIRTRIFYSRGSPINTRTIFDVATNFLNLNAMCQRYKCDVIDFLARKSEYRACAPEQCVPTSQTTLVSDPKLQLLSLLLLLFMLFVIVI